MGLEVWLLTATVVVLAVVYLRRRRTYWSSRAVSSPPAAAIIGHFHKGMFVNKRYWEFIDENYNKFYNSSMFGLYEFNTPVLLTWDTEIIKSVLVKDFDHFIDRRDFNMRTGQKRDEMMSEMLSVKKGAEWKSLRAIMTPTFTSGKIKSMFPLVCDKADALIEFSKKEAASGSYVDMKKNFGAYTLDTIASCAFGIECNSLVDSDNEFTRNMEAFFKVSLLPLFKGIFFYLMPRLFKLFGLTLNSPNVDFFIDVVEQTIASRKAGMKRGDFLDLLLEARDQSDNPNSKHVLTDLSMVSQSVLFIIAGYDTTASLLANSSFLLAKNKDQQRRLRDELRQMVAEHGKITYQGIMEAKFLDACLQESLRLYPSGAVIERLCTKSYKLPGTNLTIKPGDLVGVPFWSIQHDPNNWPNPKAFIPDRFLPENKGDIKPFTHMPFGIGPRNCIAMRFALMEAKIALSKLVLEMEMECAPGHEELVLESVSGLMRPKEVMLLLKPVKEE
ncbi:cytochrome P450 3A41-like isoform X2 [Portunus trituberculatus]|uniref:cytochrome P450 3A41-like isoform X2 n=1 Tax=Portunus trituberculatus TaxID=210409 RepID=UPI001E1CBFDF|nr:cytochrome P450 3A41-like isoform X2 [Portunus trituberculatus]XP_045105232.1 cytochrome P450 3A41-like isoform X2 [Portunus trituberculatus]XP_045105233.1 cytochrome P450 3A41-like isoform X2 [Portunus trituberculatus]